MDRIKSFVLKIWDKVQDHLASYIARYILLLLGVIFLIICFSLRKWAFTKHSLEIYGWGWLAISLLFLFLFGYLLYAVYKYFGRIKDPPDIRNVLDERCRRINEQCSEQQLELTLHFSLIDKEERLRKGSAKKYLREVVTRDGIWRVVREGPDTVLVEREPPDIQTYTE
jgi:hypothetical protein